MIKYVKGDVSIRDSLNKNASQSWTGAKMTPWYWSRVKLCQHGIRVCIPAWKKWMLSVCSQGVKVYCTLACVPNFLVGRPFIKGYKRDGNHWASWCQPNLWLPGGCGTPTFCHPHLASGDFRIFGPRKKHSVGKWRAADTDSSVPWYVWVAWCHGETVA
jgi:hypothetical protein